MAAVQLHRGAADAPFMHGRAGPGRQPRASRAVARAAARQTIIEEPEASLLDIVDNVLSKGVVVSGDITIALAQVDLIYVRLSLLLCAADRVLPHEDSELMARHHTR